VKIAKVTLATIVFAAFLVVVNYPYVLNWP